MDDYPNTHRHHHQHVQQQQHPPLPPPPPPAQVVAKETAALQALNTIIQLHFEKTLEKKRSIDAQKKHLHHHFLLFLIFLSIVFLSLVISPSSRLQCRHCWAPISFLSLAHLVFYVSVAQTLRCINGFKYQRRCHKLTLGLATERLRELRARIAVEGCGGMAGEEFEIEYQEPPESYLGKFKRNWALHFGFLILVFLLMVSTSVVLLCY
ncbi:hypothetical protein MLD38_019082 [Melastoma candidum]|uniref:Uncharacterized protein n=1 Tax=Melastoma candidum TaxID=119954 RepID=A0ACB9QX74_9MYRT|nr:hypothetical protein MLD38_019082 [Melastoma candidum]